MARSSPVPAASSAAEAGALLEHGRELLEDGRLAGLRELLAMVEALGDEHRRLWVIQELIDHELGRARADRAVETALRCELTATALEALEHQPREPELLSRAGALLELLGAHEASIALLQAAEELDPELSRTEHAPARRILARHDLYTASSVAVLEDLAGRAFGVAGRIPLADQPRLSLCMIVRDEEQALPRCLGSVAEAVDEIVIVDTGSTDRTIEIARSFGARVIRSEWEGSFALARNLSIEAARGEWILFLDADETLVEGDAARLRSLVAQTWCEGFEVSVVNYTGSLGDGTAVTHSALRMFRNRPRYRFEGRLHEQIAERLPGFLPGRIRESGVRIEHYGYLQAVREQRGKAERNIGLLRLQQAEGRSSAFLHFNLGSERAAAGEHELALPDFERAWKLLCDDPAEGGGFAPALIRRLVGTLRACGRHADSIARAREGLERFPEFTDLVFEQALAHADTGELEAAAELLERCLQMGEPPGPYPSSAGCGSYLAMVELAGLRRSLGEAGPALALLERCLREHPRYTGSIAPYIAARLARGAAAEDAVTTLGELLGGIAGEARLQLGLALRDAGAPAAAEQQLELALRTGPDRGAARVALGEALIAQRRYEDAAATLRDVGQEGPQALPAIRVELFALVAGGDLDAARRGIERARASGMSSSEVELFDAWSRISEGGPAAGRPSPAAVPRLMAMLETLLLAQDFDGFELLLELLRQSSLPERERRETLAELYLRRGFLASAAEEWMAVCASAPDVRSLLGLARVSNAQGMAREAGDFAAAALEQDPANQAAAALLSKLQLPST